jgi:hypothetical protein
MTVDQELLERTLSTQPMYLLVLSVLSVLEHRPALADLQLVRLGQQHQQHLPAPAHQP